VRDPYIEISDFQNSVQEDSRLVGYGSKSNAKKLRVFLKNVYDLLIHQ